MEWKQSYTQWHTFCATWRIKLIHEKWEPKSEIIWAVPRWSMVPLNKIFMRKERSRDGAQVVPAVLVGHQQKEIHYCRRCTLFCWLESTAQCLRLTCYWYQLQKPVQVIARWWLFVQRGVGVRWQPAEIFLNQRRRKNGKNIFWKHLRNKANNTSY